MAVTGNPCHRGGVYVSVKARFECDGCPKTDGLLLTHMQSVYSLVSSPYYSPHPHSSSLP